MTIEKKPIPPLNNDQFFSVMCDKLGYSRQQAKDIIAGNPLPEFNPRIWSGMVSCWLNALQPKKEKKNDTEIRSKVQERD